MPHLFGLASAILAPDAALRSLFALPQLRRTCVCDGDVVVDAARVAADFEALPPLLQVPGKEKKGFESRFSNGFLGAQIRK